MEQLNNLPTMPASGDTALALRIEEASLNAWPAMQQVFVDGWVLRFARGFTKRSNCIVPLYPPLYTHSAAVSAQALTEKVRYCENLYAREQLQTVFRLTSIGDDTFSNVPLDQLLDERGYHIDEPSLVLSRLLNEPPEVSAPPPGQVTMLPLDRWLAAYCELTGMPEPARTLHSLILKGISGECGFAVLPDERGRPLACGLVVVERELAGLFDIFTHPDHRNEGLGRTLLASLLHWARDNGAQRTYLQMVQANEAAAALYASLGFTEMYRYWYRIGA